MAIAGSDRSISFPSPWVFSVLDRVAGNVVFFPDLAPKTPVRVIPHGVDTSVFGPMDKAQAKEKVGVSDRFVVGTVASNQPRKNLPALVKAFATFARDKADVILYLHTRIDGHWDLEELVVRFGIEPKTRATLYLNPERGVSDDVLAMIYNSFDVFALPSMAEGFGLPILESQACGVPALVTDYSASPELVPDQFQRVKVKDKIILGRNFERAVVDETDLANRLEALYRDRSRLTSLGQSSLEFARRFEWGRIKREFVDLIGGS